MTTHEQWVDLIDNTLAILQMDLNALEPQRGTDTLNEWISAVGEGENTTELVARLEALRTQLATNPDQLTEILHQLADQTFTFSTMLGAEGDMSTRIEALATQLRIFSSQLTHVE